MSSPHPSALVLNKIATERYKNPWTGLTEPMDWSIYSGTIGYRIHGGLQNHGGPPLAIESIWTGIFTPPKFNMVHLKINPWKRRFLLETIIFRFHVKFRGSIYLHFFGDFYGKVVGINIPFVPWILWVRLEVGL